MDTISNSMDENEFETMFLKKDDFEEVKGRLKFDNPSILENFVPKDDDVIAIDFVTHSTPVIKNLSIVEKGDFTSFWVKRFDSEGVSKNNLKEAFSL